MSDNKNEKRGRGKPRKFTPAEVELLNMRHFVNGDTYESLAREYECAVSTIVRTLKRFKEAKNK